MRAAWAFAWVVALAALACGGEGEVVPRALLGRWVCADARYAGRSLTVSQRALIFAADRTASENYSVRDVEARGLSDGSTQVTITYGNEGAEGLALRVQLFPTTPASLQIGERSERWTLAPPNGSP